MWRTLLHPKFVLTKIKRFHIICFAWINYYLWRKYYYYVDYYYCCCCCFYNIFSWIRKKYKKVKWNNVRKQKKKQWGGPAHLFPIIPPDFFDFFRLIFFFFIWLGLVSLDDNVFFGFFYTFNPWGELFLDLCTHTRRKNISCHHFLYLYNYIHWIKIVSKV